MTGDQNRREDESSDEVNQESESPPSIELARRFQPATTANAKAMPAAAAGNDEFATAMSAVEQNLGILNRCYAKAQATISALREENGSEGYRRLATRLDLEALEKQIDRVFETAIESIKRIYARSDIEDYRLLSAEGKLDVILEIINNLDQLLIDRTAQKRKRRARQQPPAEDDDGEDSSNEDDQDIRSVASQTTSPRSKSAASQTDTSLDEDPEKKEPDEGEQNGELSAACNESAEEALQKQQAEFISHLGDIANELADIQEDLDRVVELCQSAGDQRRVKRNDEATTEASDVSHPTKPQPTKIATTPTFSGIDDDVLRTIRAAKKAEKPDEGQAEELQSTANDERSDQLDDQLTIVATELEAINSKLETLALDEQKAVVWNRDGGQQLLPEQLLKVAFRSAEDSLQREGLKQELCDRLIEVRNRAVKIPGIAAVEQIQAISETIARLHGHCLRSVYDIHTANVRQQILHAATNVGDKPVRTSPEAAVKPANEDAKRSDSERMAMDADDEKVFRAELRTAARLQQLRLQMANIRSEMKLEMSIGILEGINGFRLTSNRFVLDKLRPTPKESPNRESKAEDEERKFQAKFEAWQKLVSAANNEINVWA